MVYKNDCQMMTHETTLLHQTLAGGRTH